MLTEEHKSPCNSYNLTQRCGLASTFSYKAIKMIFEPNTIQNKEKRHSVLLLFEGQVAPTLSPLYRARTV